MVTPTESRVATALPLCRAMRLAQPLFNRAIPARATPQKHRALRVFLFVRSMVV